jgi:ubiquinone biosynthesis protein UbiJ
MTMKTTQWIADLFQKAINNYLLLDPASSQRLKALENKIVKINLLGVDAQFLLLFASQGIRFELPTQPEKKFDTVISGTPLRLLQMSLSRENRQQFFADDVSIQGNLELGQRVTDLFDQMDIDWEEIMSHVMGDVAAHHVGNIARDFKNWIKQTHATLRQDVIEYSQEEINLFPPAEALHDFFHDVDELRMDADRLEARVIRLKNSAHIERGKQ